MTKNILGRTEELVLLEDMLNSKKPEFLAVYGRRRVGKTFLIREFFKEKPAVFFKVTGLKEGNLSEQVRNFTEQISAVFYKNIPLQVPQNWHDTFKLLDNAINNEPKSKKVVLFFDELPWMVTQNSKFMQHLDYYWNQYWSDNSKIKLIVCGSSASFIINKIIKNTGGLHNRITRKIHLSPFSLKETKEYFVALDFKLTFQQIASLYMVTGGVPYYLAQLNKKYSIANNIERLAFTRKSLLLEEFEQLFESLFEDSESYIKILSTIAKYRDGIGQEVLLNMIGSSGKSGIEKLKALEESDFILSFRPHFHKRRGVYYRVIDEYTLFYLTWIEPIKKTLQSRSLEPGNWLSVQETPIFYNWQGYAFEAICYKHLAQIRKALKISPNAVANSWRHVPQKKSADHGAQIDLLFDRKDDAITVCEIKYTTKPFILTKDYVTQLERKVDVFKNKTKTEKQIFLALVTAQGVKKNSYSEDTLSGIVTLEDLFRF